MRPRTFGTCLAYYNDDIIRMSTEPLNQSVFRTVVYNINYIYITGVAQLRNGSTILYIILYLY